MIRSEKNVVLAGMSGNAVEWYDFTVYAFYIPILAKLFFPNTDPFISLIETLGVFAVSFLIRPLGAILFGYIGDHIGRRKTLIISIVFMSAPTFLIGILPTYQSIGISAPLLLIFLRLLQGIAVSGELTTTTSFLVEHAHPLYRGIAGSLAMCSAHIGIVASSAIAIFISYLLDNNQLEIYGWRISFLIGGILGLMGLIMRLRVMDPIHFQKVQNDFKELPMPSILGHLSTLNGRTILFAILITSIMAIGNYFLIAFFNPYLIKTIGLPTKPVMLINLAALTLQMILMPCMAKLSDKIGRKPILIIGISAVALFSYPIFLLFAEKNILSALLAEILFAISIAPIAGLIPTTLAELYDTYNRNTGLSLSYNISLALFGGTAPLIGITLVAKTHNILSPAWYLIFMALFILVLIILFFKESYRNPLK